jgi:diacylglycerol kinase (ATP)
MVRIALLANPKSGSGEAVDVARRMSELGADVRRFGIADGHDAVAHAPDRITVAGGDGSIGLAAAAAGSAEVPLAVVPVGTANDFARALGIPLDVGAATELAVRGERRQRLDLGWMDDRPFVNAASAGLSPHAARHASGLKPKLGPLAYAVGAVRAGLAAKPIECTVTCEGSTAFSGNAWQVTVGLTGAFGAGASIDADPTDAQLDCVVIEAGSRARLMIHAYGLRSGRLEEQPGTVSLRARGLEVLAVDGGFNVDGELCPTSSGRFTVAPHAYEVIVP